MLRVIEKTVFLRTLNYLRVEHSYRRQFNLILPLLFSALILAPIYAFASNPNIFGSDGLVAGFSQILAILAPFFVASLAAVATFAGNAQFDERFQMNEPVKLQVLERGQWRERHLTLRQFLSLLFGYCGVTAMFLFLVTLISPIISSGVAEAFGDVSGFAGVVFFAVFVFLFSHMLTATMLGLYYLADRMHRA